MLGLHVCAYAIRHTYISDALIAGVDPVTLSRIVGHADLKMIQTIYAKVEMRADHMKEPRRP
jgi:integrase